MANFSDFVYDYRTIRTAGNGPPVWGYPSGFSIIDLVIDDMKDVTHPHWKKFPPVSLCEIIFNFELL